MLPALLLETVGSTKKKKFLIIFVNFEVDRYLYLPGFTLCLGGLVTSGDILANSGEGSRVGSRGGDLGATGAGAVADAVAVELLGFLCISSSGVGD